jgi:hypothetical protein
VRGKGELNIRHPLANFKRFFNKNAKKKKIGDPPRNFVRKALTSLPKGFWQKSELPHLSIFNPCASMKTPIIFYNTFLNLTPLNVKDTEDRDEY